MSRSAQRLAFAGVCLIVAASARADLDVTIGNKDSVRGTLLPASETETFRFACPEGARITVTLAAKTRRMKMGMTLFDPDGVVAAGSAGHRARLRGVRAAKAGLYRVEVSSADGVTTGDYVVKAAWRSPKSFARKTAVPGNTTDDLRFSADAGAHVKFVLAAPRGSAAVPSLVRVRAHDGTTFLVSAGLRSTFVVPATGSYVLTYENAATEDGDVRAKASVQTPKAPARRLAATTREIPAGTNVVAAAVLGPGGGTLLAPGAGPLAHASVAVSPGALALPAIVVIGTTPELTPPVPSNSTRATASAFVGPLGLKFPGPAHATVALPVSLGGPVPIDAGLRVFAGKAGTTLDELSGANTDGEAVTFEAHLLTSFQGYYVIQPDVPAPFVLETSSDRALGSVAMGGGFAFVGSPYSNDAYAGGAVGEGLVRVFEHAGSTWIERAPLRSPTSVDSDIFGVTVVYRTSPLAAGDDSVLVSARDADGPSVGGKENPAIFEYVRAGSGWTYLRTLPAVQGFAFAADGNRLVVPSQSGIDMTEFTRTAQGWAAGATIPVLSLGAVTGLDMRGATLLVGTVRDETGFARRYDLGVSPAAEIAHYGFDGPQTLDYSFGQYVALGDEFAAASVSNGALPTPSVELFRLVDDAHEASIPRPILPAYGVRSPVIGPFVFHGGTLVVAAGESTPGYPFAGGYVYRKSGGTWDRVFTLDAAAAIHVAWREQAMVGAIAYDGTSVVVPIGVYHYDNRTMRSAMAFFDLPPE